MDLSCATCCSEDLERMSSRLSAAVADGITELAVLVLPGSFNPVHSDHLRCLELARAHLLSQGVHTLAGFLQPSSDQYVLGKLDGEAMSLQNRVTACKIAARDHSDWVAVWRSGESSGSKATKLCEGFLHNKFCGHGARILAFQVCGADFVERCSTSRWSIRAMQPKVVIARSGSQLPPGPPGEGWHVVWAGKELGRFSALSVRRGVNPRKIQGAKRHPGNQLSELTVTSDQCCVPILFGAGGVGRFFCFSNFIGVLYQLKKINDMGGKEEKAPQRRKCAETAVKHALLILQTAHLSLLWQSHDGIVGLAGIVTSWMDLIAQLPAKPAVKVSPDAKSTAK
ncbi:unnamed protein product [Polarella glacialis]|uniref:Cytidyltransferase-like domain-containing protein n=1 Tax=Polarella glacialis TaxID=89957 RepID=A0A813KK62_POLGL|nr:unnamed protein product [Polarella glacialis]